MVNKDKLDYCGLGIYADFSTGSVFEKEASGDMKEVEDEKSAVEKRFIERNSK